MTRSLRELDSIPDRIRQHRQADPRGIVVVEGPSDKRFLERITSNSWAVFIAGTRNEVPVVVRNSQALDVERIVGLIDRDFDEFFELEISNGSSLCSFEEADLEAELFRGPWFSDLVNEHGSEKKIAKNGGPDSLRVVAIEIAGLVGVLRRANAENGWGIDFGALNFSKKIKVRDLSFDLSGFIAGLNSRIEDPEGRQLIASMLRGFDPKTCCESGSFRGRDALEVVRIALKSVYGTRVINGVEELAAGLRLAADGRVLETGVFRDITSRIEV